MKKFINITLVLFAAVLLLSCRNGDNDIPEDIHEHEEIEKIEMTVTDKNDASNVQTISIVGGVGTPNLVLENGKTYKVSLDFQVKHDDHYHSANGEIEEEKDEHFIVYAFANSNVSVKRAANDIVRTDGKKLGLETEWTVAGAPNSGAKVNIKLIHGPTSVNDNFPSADNQLGSTVGGESDVDASVNIQ